MSTILNTNGTPLEVPQITPDSFGKFFIVTAEWNSKITHALRDGARRVLLKAGVAEDRIIMVSVPGTVELVNAAGAIILRSEELPARGSFDTVEAIIVLGCVIRGDTPHFDYVCSLAANGIARLNAKGVSPVIFGVLTVENEEQALQRAGGELGNKGEEAADAAVRMVNLHDVLNKELFV